MDINIKDLLEIITSFGYELEYIDVYPIFGKNECRLDQRWITVFNSDLLTCLEKDKVNLELPLRGIRFSFVKPIQDYNKPPFKLFDLYFIGGDLYTSDLPEEIKKSLNEYKIKEVDIRLIKGILYHE